MELIDIFDGSRVIVFLEEYDNYTIDRFMHVIENGKQLIKFDLNTLTQIFHDDPLYAHPLF